MARTRKPKYRCGFCQQGNHERCPHEIRNGINVERASVKCACCPPVTA